VSDDVDMFDCPGCYQARLGLNNGTHMHKLHVREVFEDLATDKPKYVLEFMDRRLYIRKRWWVRIQTTPDVRLATKWNSHEEAREWALKRKLDVS